MKHDVLLDDLPMSEWPLSALESFAARGNRDAAAELRRRESASAPGRNR